MTSTAFDFWLGEWTVQNRVLDVDGSWLDTDQARVRITPLLDGQLVLEEWVGPFFGETMHGFSIRSHDPATGEWHLVLYWTTSGDAAFTELRGEFRRGRGEFFSHADGISTRYTFSDISADSVRWDSATSPDDGSTWRTDWIMEFTRTAPASSNTNQIFDAAWNPGTLTPFPAARQLDWTLGTWTGDGFNAVGERIEVEYRAGLVSQDTLIVDTLRTRTRPEAEWDESVSVSGYVNTLGTWQRWSSQSKDPVLRPYEATVDDNRAEFTASDADVRWAFERRDESIVITVGDQHDSITVELARVADQTGSGPA